MKMAQTRTSSSKSGSKAAPSRSKAASKPASRANTAIDIQPKTRTSLVDLLSATMADNFDLYSQTKVAHWNVKGRDFMQLHLLFDQVAEMIEPFTDTLAERIALLGGIADGSVRGAAKASSIPEFPVTPAAGGPYLEALQERWAQHAQSVREAAGKAGEMGDPTTEDMFVELSREVDQGLYFIESHLLGDEA